MTIDSAQVHERAMLVSLSISSWSARKFDRAISKEVAEQHGVDANAGRYNKNLMPDEAASYKALNKHLSSLRDEHYANTLPWTDDGWRMLPIRHYQKYMDLVRKGIHEAESLLDAFVAEYPSLRETAISLRSGIVSDADFPKHIRSRYAFSIEVGPVPSGSDFRLAIPKAELDAHARHVEERVKAAFEAAQSDAVRRLYDVLARMTERLSDPKAIFRDSLIGNVREVCDILTGLNLAEDPALEAVRRQAELLAASTEPQTLRDDAAIRADAAKQAQDILTAMTATYGAGMFAN